MRLKVLAIGSALFFGMLVPAMADGGKKDATPAFCQLDPQAAFPGKGSNFCAPVSLSDQLLYLSTKPSLAGLVKGTDKNAQIALIRELSTDMSTNPSAGTDPDHILTGLETYVRAHGFKLRHLQVVTWRPISKTNLQFRTGEKPTRIWIDRRSNDPDGGLIINVGWYQSKPQGLVRNGGHWVAVVGSTGVGRKLYLRNPLLATDVQKAQAEVTLRPLAPATRLYRDAKGKPVPTAGVYVVEGPGLPYPKSYQAIVDCAIAFKLGK